MAKNSAYKFSIKNCLFGATNTVRNSDKEKYTYSDYGIAFDRKGECNFGNGYVRSVTVFGVVNNSSSHSDNIKNRFLISGEGDTYGINGNFDAPEKKFSINFSKVKTISLKLTIKMLTFQLNFVSKVFLMDFVLLSLEKYL